MYYAPDQEAARLVADDVLKEYQASFAAAKSFQDDWEACVGYRACPPVNHQRTRTTELLERSFLEKRRRTEFIPRFSTEKSCLKLAFATLWRTPARDAKV